MKNYWLRIQPGDQLIGPLNARQLLQGLHLRKYAKESKISPVTEEKAELPAGDAVWTTLGDPATQTLLRNQAALSKAPNESTWSPDSSYRGLRTLPWRQVLTHYSLMRGFAMLLRILVVVQWLGAFFAAIVIPISIAAGSFAFVVPSIALFVGILLSSFANAALAEFIELVIRTSSDVAYLAERQGRPVDPPQQQF